MTLRTASLFALIGMALLTLLLALEFVRTISGVIDGVVPSVSLIRSLIHLFAGLGVAFFFYVFYRSQAR